MIGKTKNQYTKRKEQKERAYNQVTLRESSVQIIPGLFGV